MKKRVAKTLTYKQARFESPGPTLQTMLQTALGKFPKVLERHRPLDETATGFHAWNHQRMFRGMLFGELVHYTEGQHQQLLAMAPDATEHELEHEPPPTKSDGKQREFLNGSLFFGVVENHIVLVQGQAMLSRDFERYLRWLLQDRAQILTKERNLYVADNPPQQTRERIKKRHVRSIAIGSDLETQPLPDDAVDRFEWTGRAAEIIRAALGSDWVPTGGFEQSMDDANVKVKLEIRYKRKTTLEAQRMLDEIAVSLRHQEPDDTEVRLNGGGIIKGDDLRLSTRLFFDRHNGAVERNTLCERMAEWLHQSIESGDAWP